MMSKNVKEKWRPANPQGIAKQFSRLGWIDCSGLHTVACIPGYAAFSPNN
jgi:hypothetical protein